MKITDETALQAMRDDHDCLEDGLFSFLNYGQHYLEMNYIGLVDGRDVYYVEAFEHKTRAPRELCDYSHLRYHEIAVDDYQRIDRVAFTERDEAFAYYVEQMRTLHRHSHL